MSNKGYFGNKLIESINAGDDHVLKLFYTEHKTGFLSWARKKFTIEDEAILDFYHDAIAILVLNIKQKKITDTKKDSMISYVYKTAQNLILNSIDKRGVQQRHANSFEEHYIFIKEGSEGDQRIDIMKRAVGLLQEPCASILRLFYYEAFSMKDIADKLGYKNHSVVRNQKKRCMEYLKEAYSKIVKQNEK